MSRSFHETLEKTLRDTWIATESAIFELFNICAWNISFFFFGSFVLEEDESFEPNGTFDISFLFVWNDGYGIFANFESLLHFLDRVISFGRK